MDHATLRIVPEPFPNGLCNSSPGVRTLCTQYHGNAHRTLVEKVHNFVKRPLQNSVHFAETYIRKTGIVHHLFAYPPLRQKKGWWAWGQAYIHSAFGLNRFRDDAKERRYIRPKPGGECVATSNAKHTGSLSNGAVRLRQVVEAEIADDPIEGSVRKRQRLGVPGSKTRTQPFPFCSSNHFC